MNRSSSYRAWTDVVGVDARIVNLSASRAMPRRPGAQF